MTPREEKLSSAAASDGLPLLPRGRNLCDDRPEGWSTPSSRSSAGLVTSTTHGDLNGDLEQMPTCMGPMVWGNRGELRGAASVSLCAICLTINPKHSPHPARCPHHGSLHHDLGPSRAEVVVNSHLPTDAMCSCARCAGDMNGGAGPDAAPHDDNSVKFCIAADPGGSMRNGTRGRRALLPSLQARREGESLRPPPSGGSQVTLGRAHCHRYSYGRRCRRRSAAEVARSVWLATATSHIAAIA